MERTRPEAPRTAGRAGPLAAVALALAIAGPAGIARADAAAPGGRDMPVAVARERGDVVSATLRLLDPASGDWARIRARNPALTVGDRISICASATRDGLLSVWSRTDDGALPVRVFPNDFTPEDRRRKGGPITAGDPLCLGDATRGYGFEVLPPLGQAEIYLHWSPSDQGQFGPEDIPVIPDHAAGARPAQGRGPGAPYSATVLRYRVLSAGEG